MLMTTVMENIPNRFRSLVSNFFMMSFSIASAILPWIAYFLKDWQLLSMMTSIPALIVAMVAW